MRRGRRCILISARPDAESTVVSLISEQMGSSRVGCRQCSRIVAAASLAYRPTL